MAEDQEKLAALAQMKNCADLADFIIVADGKTWNVHRLVLAMHSNVLKQMCSGNFQEAIGNRLDWSEYHEDVIQAFCDFLYSFDYKTNGYGSWFSCGLVFHVHMAVIADKYNVPALYALANRKFKTMLDSEYAEDELADAAAVAYEYSVATKEMCSTIVHHLVNNKLGSIPEQSKAVMKEHPQFAIDVADSLYLKTRPVVTLKTKGVQPSAKFRCDCDQEIALELLANDPHISCSGCGIARRQNLWKPIPGPDIW